MMEIPIVLFQIDEVEFGLDVYQIRDIIRLDSITRVPNCPDYIIGVINLRGAIIPVINLRKRLHFSNVQFKQNSQILVCEYGNEVAGLVVDSVSEVTNISSHLIQPRPRYLVNNIDSNYLLGLSQKQDTLHTDKSNFIAQNAVVGGKFILLLDLCRVLNLKTIQNSESNIKKIVERKKSILNEEREKIRQNILKLKDQKKLELQSIHEKELFLLQQKNRNRATKFQEEQTNVINKIKSNRENKLRLEVKETHDNRDFTKLLNSNKEQQSKNNQPANLSEPKRKKRVIIKRKNSNAPKKNQDPDSKMKPKMKEPEPKFGKIQFEYSQSEFEQENDVFDPYQNLNELQLSLIQEIGNIGAGNAATALSTMIDKRVDISVPTVDICPTEDLPALLGGRDQLVLAIYLAVQGDVSMYMMLVFERPSGLKLADMLLFQKRSEEELNGTGEINQMDESALMELGNILGSHYLTALTDFTKIHMIPGPPSLTYDMLSSVVDFIQIELEEAVERAFILNTDIMVEEEKIDGYILMLPVHESIKTMVKNMGL